MPAYAFVSYDHDDQHQVSALRPYGLMAPVGKYVVAISFLLAACVSTELSSQTDPDFRGAAFKRVLIIAEFRDLGLRQTAEKKFVHEVREAGGFALTGSMLLPAGRPHSAEDIQRACRKHKLDAFAVISATAAGTTDHYVPPTWQTEGTAHETTDAQGKTTRTETSSTVQTGGYTFQTEWAQFSAALHDATSGRLAWTATATSKGNRFTKTKDIAKSIGGKVALSMLTDGILATR